MKIGLTGSIASGKTTVSNYLLSKGIPVIDADKISKDLCEIGNQGYIKIKEQFDNKLFNKDNSLNRKAMAEYIFSKPSEKSKLENILHPLIREKMLEEYESYKNNGNRIVFFDIPLLFETSMQSMFDKTWVVHTDIENQVERLYKRSKYSPDLSRKIIQNQMSSEEKMKLADIIIENNSSLEFLYKKIDKLLIEMEQLCII